MVWLHRLGWCAWRSLDAKFEIFGFLIFFQVFFRNICFGAGKARAGQVSPFVSRNGKLQRLAFGLCTMAESFEPFLSSKDYVNSPVLLTTVGAGRLRIIRLKSNLLCRFGHQPETLILLGNTGLPIMVPWFISLLRSGGVLAVLAQGPVVDAKDAPAKSKTSLKNVPDVGNIGDTIWNT